MLPTSILDEIQKNLNSFWWGLRKDGKCGIKWLVWDKLSVKKANGGMGFRDLHCFNIVMLGEIGWQLCFSSDTLVYKILKAKYFPRGDFLKATLGSNPSFTRQSIFESLPLLKQGIRWRIGNGTQIDVWTDPWLRDDRNFWVQMTHNVELDGLRVSDLMILGRLEWDVEMLEELLEARDDVEIKCIPLSQSFAADRQVWHFTNSGEYTIKSGYHEITQLLGVHSQLS